MVHANNPLEMGLQAYRSGDDKKAESHWLNASKQGDLAAQFYLSVLYGKEGGAVEDRQLSIEWLTR